MAHRFLTSCLEDSRDLLRYYKKLGDRAIAQAPDAGLFAALDPQSNSIATIVKHLAGNMRSRWTDFLASDGEKPDRNRDSEFQDPPKSRAELLALWERGWGTVFAALDPLADADSGRTVAIRGEPHSVTQAIHRQLAHYAYHVGQIVYLARYSAGDGWQSLSVPRDMSRQFNADVAAARARRR